MNTVKMILSMASTHSIDNHGVQLSESNRLTNESTRHFDPPIDSREHADQGFIEVLNTKGPCIIMLPEYSKKKSNGEYEYITNEVGSLDF